MRIIDYSGFHKYGFYRLKKSKINHRIIEINIALIKIKYEISMKTTI